MIKILEFCVILEKSVVHIQGSTNELEILWTVNGKNGFFWENFLKYLSRYFFIVFFLFFSKAEVKIKYNYYII